jgi:spore coat protein U-like protein
MGSVCRADTATVSVSATIDSGGACWFTTAGTTLDFGTLDPGNPVDVTVGSTLQFRCFGWPSVTYYVADDDGLYETAPDANRMRHTSLPGAYLPYSLDLAPRTGTISWSPFILHTLTFTGTVRGVDYQNAFVGTYSDTVVVTITP